MTTVMKTFGMRCPCCKRDDAVDIQALLWVRLTPRGTDADLCDDGAHEWDNASAARCSACGWEGRAGDTLSRKPKHLIGITRSALLQQLDYRAPPVTQKGCRKVMLCISGFRSMPRRVAPIIQLH
jgi:hypothetical protein